MTDRTPTLAEIIRTAIENRLADVHVMLPGRVERYLPDEQKVDVQPMIQRFQEGAAGETISETYPVIPGVPVAFPSSGKFKLTFPIAAGDFVTLVFCESSIDAYQASSGNDPISPDLFQRFDLSDAIAVPGWRPDPKKISDPDNEAAVLGYDGGAAVRVLSDAVRLYESISKDVVAGASVHVADDQVNLYQQAAADFVALAALVLTELQAVKTDFDNFLIAVNAHVHAGTGTPFPPIVFVPHTPSSVAAQKVKAT
jgi:hypothetical protein